MPENKLQHYVPKCHLRPFCSEEGSAAINVFNIERSKVFQNAPIKGQCARDYFYGKDLILEKALQASEVQYGATIAKLNRDPGSVAVGNLTTLRTFSLLQTFRTYGYVEKLIAKAAAVHELIKNAAPPGVPPPPQYPQTIQEAVPEAISHFLSAMKKGLIDDLEMRLIVNETRIDFFTSDDPAIHTNRFHFQKLGRAAFGLVNAGSMYFLPLTPRLYFIAYDPDIYVPANKKSLLIVIRHDNEARTLNQLQLLQARSNIYFSSATMAAQIQSEFRSCAEFRPVEWHKLHVFQKVEDQPQHAEYARIDKMALEPGQEFLIGMQSNHIRPKNWTNVVAYRLLPRLVNTGTAVGYVRIKQMAELERRRRDL
jgi:hypothetical protein